MKYNVTGWLIAEIAALIAGPYLAYALNAFEPVLISKGAMTLTTYAYINLGERAFGMMPQAVISALWIAGVARRENEKVLLWSLFGLGFGVVGVAVFFGVLSFKRWTPPPTENERKRPNNSPEATPGQAQPTAPSLSPGAPQL